MPENFIAVNGIQQTTYYYSDYQRPFDVLIGHTNFLMCRQLFVWLQSQVENTGDAIKYIVFTNWFMSAERQNLKDGNNQVSRVNNQPAAYSIKSQQR
jgi:hypothetical protein